MMAPVRMERVLIGLLTAGRTQNQNGGGVHIDLAEGVPTGDIPCWCARQRLRVNFSSAWINQGLAHGKGGDLIHAIRDNISIRSLEDELAAFKSPRSGDPAPFFSTNRVGMEKRDGEKHGSNQHWGQNSRKTKFPQQIPPGKDREQA